MSRIMIAAALALGMVWTAAAQTTFTPNPAIWDGVFSTADTGSVRWLPANRQYPQSGYQNLVMDSELVTAERIACLHFNADGGKCGINMYIADFFYSGARRRTVMRSLILREVDDPPELNFGRAPGTYPNQPDYTRTNDPDHIIGMICGQRWTGSNGFSNCTTQIQFLEERGIILRAGTGDSQAPVKFHIDVDRIVSSERLLLTKTGGNVPFDVRRVDVDVEGFSATVACAVNEIVISGGGSCDRGSFRLNRPNGNGWEVVCHESGHNRVMAFCASY